jgi:diadenosine tetraphosphate (Ap4A) HIT family hydrolase
MLTPTHSDCPFCRSNQLLKEVVVAASANAYLVPAYGSPGCYLIVPEVHTESLLDLPDTWWQEVKGLLPQVPGLTGHYNLSLNMGEHAGQTVKHIHFWVIPRSADQPSGGKGLAGLIAAANQE